jgi:transposase
VGHYGYADFGASLRRDLAAVQAVFDLPWTTSPAEGQINRPRMLKRTMYGRAGFPLLHTRVLHAERCRNGSTESDPAGEMRRTGAGER